MNCKINTNALNPHMKAAIVRAKVDGVIGEIINVDEHGDVTVLFTHNNEGDKKNQVFPMAGDQVTVQV